MAKFTALFKASYQELKSVRCITLTAMLGAISIVLGSLVIMVGDFLKIGFTFLPNEFVFYLFGPVVGMIYAAAMDILTFFVRPEGPFFYGFTVSAVLSGLIYGTLLYRRPLSLRRIIFANTVHLILINFFLNTYWLTVMYGYNFLAIFPLRALKSSIMLPIETALLYMVIRGVEATGIIQKLFPDKKAKV